MLKWTDLLPQETMDLRKRLIDRAMQEIAQGKTIYPPTENILRALRATPPDKVKVVILGQDPYHEEGQGNGLAFSVNPGVPLPPSLKNIFKELQSDIGCEMPASGDLSAWAGQGVLLLNTVLTVEKGKANSHKDWGWQEYVRGVLQVCASLPQPVVFLLWGGQAKKTMDGIQFSGGPKYCLCSSHPSPLGAYKPSGGAPPFIGSRPFSRANELLKQHGEKEIDWSVSVS